MDLVDGASLAEALGLLFANPMVWVVVPVGIVIGLFFGAIPGLSIPIAMAVCLPATFGMDLVSAILLLTAIFTGGAFGTAIPAVLMNVPGTAGSVATCFDGYPMTLKGRHNEALGLALAASATGSLLGYVVLFVLIDSIAGWVLKLGPPEMFVLIVWGVALIAVLSEGNIWKGLLTGITGLLIGTIGVSAEGLERGTMGSIYLLDGVPVVPAMIGLFAASELFGLIRREFIIENAVARRTSLARIMSGFNSAFSYPRTLLRGGLIGVAIGALPGIGAAIASLVSYAAAKRPDSSFGKGDPEGVIAAESANSSSEGGSLGTLLALGLPGGSAGAVMLGALAMHNVTGGPRFLAENQPVVYAIIIGNFVQVLALFVIGLAFMPLAGRLVSVPARILVPIVLILTVLGSYALTSDMSGPVTVVLAGFAGFFLRRYGFAVAPMVIGLLLGRAAEGELLRSYQLAGGDITFIMSRPIVLGLVAVTLVFFLGRRYLARRRNSDPLMPKL